MTHSFKAHNFHLIWSTKKRLPLIEQEIQPKLYAYIAGIIKKHKGFALEIGGMSDHIHILLQISNIDKYSYLIRDMKSNSTLWMHKTYPKINDFGWQEGFASYSVSHSGIDAVRNYIQKQEEHHKVMTFAEEYRKFLEKHQFKFDERYYLD